MASDKPGRTPHPFDVAMIEKLIGLMTRHDLTEIDLHDGDKRIQLRKGESGTGGNTPVAAPAAPVVAPAPANPAASASGSLPDTGKYHIITSPTPGTFYAKPSPDEPAYVKVGSRVSSESVVCKIEAMKIFNDIQAECSGVIAEILVENAQPVEYGQPLFKVSVG